MNSGERPSRIRYRVVAWLTSAAVLAYLCRNSIGVAESTIREELGLTEVQSGLFMSSFFWAYALCQIPSAWLGQVWGTRLALSLFAALWSIAIAMIGLAPALWVLIAAQVFMGIAQAGVFPCTVQSIARWIPETNRGSCCAYSTMGMQVGAIIASSLTGLLLAGLVWNGSELLPPGRWRTIFLIYSIPGLLWAIAFWVRFRNRPEDHPGVNAAELARIRGDEQPSKATSASAATRSEEDPEEVLSATSEEGAISQSTRPDGDDAPTGRTPWVAILTNPAILALCSQQFFRAAAYAFFTTWFPTFLQKTRGISIAESGYLQSSVLIAVLLGSVSGGWLIDQIYRSTRNLWLSRSGVGASCMILCGLLILSAWFAESVTMMMGLIAVAAFFAAFAGPCAYVTTIDIGGRFVPPVFGLMNMSGNFGAAVSPTVVGWFFLQTDNWNLILVVFGVTYLIAAGFWLMMNPNRKVSAI